MATIDCPHKHRWISELSDGKLIIVSTAVTIFNGICDSCDKCGFSECEYFDTSALANRRFEQGLLAANATVSGSKAEELYQESLRLKHSIPH